MNIYDLYEKVGKRNLRTVGLDGFMPHIIVFFESLFLTPTKPKFNTVGDLSNYRFDKIEKGVQLLLKYKNKDRFFVYGKDWKEALDIAKESFNFTDEITFNNGFAMFYGYRSNEIRKYMDKIKLLNVTFYKLRRTMSIFIAGLTGHTASIDTYKFSPQFTTKHSFYSDLKGVNLENYGRIRYRETIEGIYYLWGLIDITIKEAYLARYIIEYNGYEQFILDNFDEKLIQDMVINQKVSSSFYGDPIQDNKAFGKILKVMSLEDALKLSFNELSEKVDLK